MNITALPFYNHMAFGGAVIGAATGIVKGDSFAKIGAKTVLGAAGMGFAGEVGDFATKKLKGMTDNKSLRSGIQWGPLGAIYTAITDEELSGL